MNEQLRKDGRKLKKWCETGQNYQERKVFVSNKDESNAGRKAEELGGGL